MENESKSAPESLKSLQEEFGKSIRVPFSFHTGRFQCRREEYSPAAAAAVNPRGNQDGNDRLAVYNEQYWYRLLTVLQEDFPLLVDSLGLWEFNQLASAYLDAHPSLHPYLQNLPAGLPVFIRNEARFNHPRLVQIADLEFALHWAFHAPDAEAFRPGLIDGPNLESLGEIPLGLQSWIFPLQEDWNLVERRVQVAGGDTEKREFLEGKNYWVVFRREGVVEWMEIDRPRFLLLQEFQRGCALRVACESAADALDPQELEHLVADISFWFKDWTSRKWFRRAESKALEKA